MKPLLVFTFFFCTSLIFAQQAPPANILVADTAGMSWLGSATIGGNTYLYITVTGTGPQPAPALGHYYSSDGGAHWSGSI
jgi:hypothetical protein